MTTEVAIVKPMKAAVALSAIVLAILASAPALAGHSGGHVRFGVFIGGPIYPWYPWGYPYYPYYPYYPPAAPATPPTYIEQGETQQQQGYWYYCAASKTYYPYVKECPAGWQRVVPQPRPGG